MFEVYRAENGSWNWNLRLSGATSRIIATNSLPFTKRSAALRDIERVREIAPDADVIEVLPRLAAGSPVVEDGE
jgi:uncharacterized protein YegP (UPF0339 family)